MTRGQEKRDRARAAGRMRKIVAALETWQREFNEFDGQDWTGGALRHLRAIVHKLEPDSSSEALTGKGE